MKWEPIETAPKDGAMFIVAFGNEDEDTAPWFARFCRKYKEFLIWSADKNSWYAETLESEGLTIWHPMAPMPEPSTAEAQ